MTNKPHIFLSYEESMTYADLHMTDPKDIYSEEWSQRADDFLMQVHLKHDVKFREPVEWHVNANAAREFYDAAPKELSQVILRCEDLDEYIKVYLKMKWHI